MERKTRLLLIDDDRQAAEEMQRAFAECCPRVVVQWVTYDSPDLGLGSPPHPHLILLCLGAKGRSLALLHELRAKSFLRSTPILAIGECQVDETTELYRCGVNSVLSPAISAAHRVTMAEIISRYWLRLNISSH